MAARSLEHLRRPAVAAFRFIRTTLLGIIFATPGIIPKRLRHLSEDIGHFVLPEIRPRRRFPRAVKAKMSNYPRKHPAGDKRLWGKR